MRFRSVFRYSLMLAAVFCLALPLRSAEPEKEYGMALTDLLPELKQSYGEALESDSLMVNNGSRRQQIAEMIRSADEVAVMIYTQRPGFAIDMALALENVSRVYDSFSEHAHLSDKYLAASRSGLRRYSLLGETLRDMWVSVCVMSLAGILSLVGYSMIGVFLLTFWTFELALLHTITTIYYLMKRYNESRVIIRKARYHKENPFLPLEDKEDFIEVTWIYDLLRMVVLPVTILLSFPIGVRLTSHAYQLSLTGADIMNRALFKREGAEYITLRNLLIIIALFFVFRFLVYLVRNMVRIVRLRGAADKKRPSALPVKKSDVNTSLSDTIFSLIGWLVYVIIVLSILRTSTSSLKTILAGLAAGVGFALKDLINNFFYGVQLMAGRIKVGDKISCDGVRGIVKRVSYQTTTIEDEDGSLIAFTNTDLFSKKFRNLNSGKNYELLKMPVSVRYGTDIARARDVILEALKPLMVKDKSGRDIVDPSFPVDVRFDNFGDSSINLIVALYSTVETHYTFPSSALEAIYNAFYENGIEIPFPQRDVYVKTPPEDERDRVKM